MFLDTWVLLTVAELFAPVQQKVGPKRRLARSIHVCEPTDRPWRLPAEVMYLGSARKDVLFGAVWVYTVAVQGRHGIPGSYQSRETRSKSIWKKVPICWPDGTRT